MPLLPSGSFTRGQLDVQVAVERVRDAEEGVDARRPTTALEPGDRRLRRPDQVGELALGQIPVRQRALGHFASRSRRRTSRLPRRRAVL